MNFFKKEKEGNESSPSKMKILNDDSIEKIDVTQEEFKRANDELMSLLDGSDEGCKTEEIITIQSDIDSSEDFIIIQDSKSPWRMVKKVSALVFTVLIVASIGALLLMSALYKIIPEDIKGAAFTFNTDKSTLCLISKSFQPNLDELRQGDIIFINKTPDILPIIYNYDALKYNFRKGVILYCEDEYGNEFKIQSTEVDYISRVNVR